MLFGPETRRNIYVSTYTHAYFIYAIQRKQKISTYKNNNRTLVLWRNEGHIVPLKRSQVKTFTKNKYTVSNVDPDT